MSSCDLCDRPRAGGESFSLMAVRIIDGELLDDVDYCWEHALEVALGRTERRLEIRPEHLGRPLDECYRSLCSCLPSKQLRCMRCSLRH